MSLITTYANQCLAAVAFYTFISTGSQGSSRYFGPNLRCEVEAQSIGQKLLFEGKFDSSYLDVSFSDRHGEFVMSESTENLYVASKQYISGSFDLSLKGSGLKSARFSVELEQQNSSYVGVNGLVGGVRFDGDLHHERLHAKPIDLRFDHSSSYAHFATYLLR